MAHRQVRRAWVSSLLVASLVALPIAGMAGFLVYSASSIATPEERLTAELGEMEAWVEAYGLPGSGFWQYPTEPEWNGYPIDDDGAMVVPDPGDISPVDDPADALPAGADVVALTRGTALVETPAGSAGLPAWAGEAWDPRFAGAFDLVEGERPRGPGEAMVTPAALDRLGIGLGDELRLADGSRSYTVVGTLDAAPLADRDAAVFLPASARETVGGKTRWYIAEPALAWAGVQELNDQGFVAFSRAVVLDPPPFENRWYSSGATDRWAQLWPLFLAMTVAGLFAGYVVVMLAGAAFAVAARRQQRALAVAASVGADRRDLSRVILLQGSVLGLVGGVVGVLAGVGLGAAVMALVSDGSATQFWGFHAPVELLAIVLIFAVVVGTVSAWMPARRVGRTDPLQALRGARRPQKPVASRPVWGSVLLITGVAITLVSAFAVAAINATGAFGYDSPLRYIPAYGIVVGPILAQFGILLSGRWLLWVASRALTHAGTAAKISSRDAAANAARSVPAFAAIAATVFVGVFALGQASMLTAQTARQWFYDAPVGSIAIGMYPGSSNLTGSLTAEDRDRAVAGGMQLTRDAGAENVAVLSRQQPSWSFASPADLPDGYTFTLALLPDQYLLDPENGSFQSMGQDPGNPISVVAADDLATALGVELTASDLAAYRAGAAVVTDQRFVTDGSITLDTFDGVDQYEGRVPDNVFQRLPDAPPVAEPVASERVDAIFVDAPLQPVSIAVAPATAERLGMTTVPDRMIAAPPEPLTQDDRDRLQSQSEALSTSRYVIGVRVESGPPSDAAWTVPLLSAVAALVLAASAVALGLARFERRPDDATLAAVGAPRGLRRRINFWQGLIIAGFGTLAGALAGILPPIGFAIQSGGTQRLSDVPWWLIAGLALALPLAIAVANAIVPPRHPDLTRRTVIT